MNDFEKIRKIEDTITKNRHKLMNEKDSKKRSILQYKVQIDELRIKIIRLKD